MDLFNHFYNIFGKERENNSSIKDEVQLTINNLDNSDFIQIDIEESDLFLALKDTRTSNVRGPDGISSFQIKNCNDSFIFNVIFQFFQAIFKFGFIPSQLNYSFIKPILKDY
jgi:hypothetical protein